MYLKRIALFSLFLLSFLPDQLSAQTLTQADFTGVLVPRYMASGTATRLSVVYRATISNLTPNKLYRFYTQACRFTDIGASNSGAGNPVFINLDSANFGYTSSTSTTTAGGYSIFRASDAGTYTGWFGFVNTGNARFTGGNYVIPSIVLADSAGAVQSRKALSDSIRVIGFNTLPTDTNGTGIWGKVPQAPKDMVLLYDNTEGTGRPLAITYIESEGVNIASTVGFYTDSVNAKDNRFGTIIPNNNANGVKRFERRSLLTGEIVASFTSANGTWNSTVNTVNPTGGTTALAVTLEVNTGITFNYSVVNGWNMVSVPVAASPMTASAVFATANSPVFAYNNGYSNVTDLVYGSGYWVRFPAAASFPVTGQPISNTSIPIVAGWNLIGGYHIEFPANGFTTTPSDIINSAFYGYDAGYYNAISIQPGKGYWVRSTAAGLIHIIPSQKQGMGTVPVIEKNWTKMIISDAAGSSTTLYAAETAVNSGAFTLPPVPPAGVFDARFSSGSQVENLTIAKQISISGAVYPVTIRTDGMSISVSDVTGNMLNTNSNTAVISNPAIQTVEVSALQKARDFALQQNFPNPFNPETMIGFSIPVQSHVVLSVFNQLGEKVAELKNETLPAGNHSVVWNAAHVPSGVYFYEIKAGQYSAVKKLILMK